MTTADLPHSSQAAPPTSATPTSSGPLAGMVIFLVGKPFIFTGPSQMAKPMISKLYVHLMKLSIGITHLEFVEKYF